jgi:hypothetical protein
MSVVTAVCVVAGLLCAQSDQPNTGKLRTTYGPLGAVRSNNDFLPGDDIYLCFEIDDAKADTDGKVRYSIGMEALDSKGNVLFKQAPHESTAAPPAPGKSLQACAMLEIGLDQPPGDYNVKVSFKDLVGGASKVFSGQCRVLPVDLGFVRVKPTLDPNGSTPAPALSTEKSNWLNMAVIGFARDRTTGQPQLDIELQVTDDQGRPLFANPSVAKIRQDVPEKVRAIPMQFELVVHRPGKYTIELKASDGLTGKRAALSFPVVVGSPQ